MMSMPLLRTFRSEFDESRIYNAKLENANFSGADLRGVVFNGAVLTNVFMELTSAMASAISAMSGADWAMQF